jgi:sporulation protein YlmC with PRC-barrel domain
MKRTQWIPLTVAVATLATLGIAQDDKTQRQEPKPQSTPTQSARTASHKTPQILLARDLVGRSVTNPANENIGKIEDVVVRPNGDIGFAVLSFGGVMGVGEKLFAIPWSLLKTGDPMLKEPGDPAAQDAAHKRADNVKIVLPIDKERLKNAPGFDKKNWPSLANADWTREVDTYYGPDTKDHQGRPMEAGAKLSTVAFKASDLKGMNVETPSGDKLGDIEDVAVDIHGHVSYVVVSVGGFLGMGERHVAVPWRALQASTKEGDKKKLLLPTTKERLEKAPQFSKAKDKWTQMTDPAWVETVYDYYSVEPYWTDGD